MFNSSFESFVFTKSAALRLLDATCVNDLQVWANCIWVKFYKQVGSKLKCFVRFVSKSKFYNQFAIDRKYRSRSVTVTQNVFNKDQYSARSSRGNDLYHLEVFDSAIACTCDDYKNQVNLFSSYASKLCKHGYAVLSKLGFSSLSDYIQFKEDEDRIQAEYEYRCEMAELMAEAYHSAYD